jgi:hypothetical protein
MGEPFRLIAGKGCSQQRLQPRPPMTYMAACFSQALAAARAAFSVLLGRITISSLSKSGL